MPIYPWACDSCEQTTDVQRVFAEIDIPPETCDHCSNPSFKNRLIVRRDGTKSYILADSGLGWPSHGFYAKPYNPKESK